MSSVDVKGFEVIRAALEDAVLRAKSGGYDVSKLFAAAAPDLVVMSNEASAALRAHFTCPACKGNLKQPIKSCVNGHNVCEECKQPVDKCAQCQKPQSASTNVALERLIVELGLAVMCKYHKIGCDFKDGIDSVHTHEVKCQFRAINCPVLPCYAQIKFNQLDEHMSAAHADMADGEWKIMTKVAKTGAPLLAKSKAHFGMRSWVQHNVRFFATVLVDTDNWWYSWITAACDEDMVGNFRSDIRLAQELEPTVVFTGDILHLECALLKEEDVPFRKLPYRRSCWPVYHSDIEKYKTTDLNKSINTEKVIPFACSCSERVPKTEDMDEESMAKKRKLPI